MLTKKSLIPIFELCCCYTVFEIGNKASTLTSPSQSRKLLLRSHQRLTVILSRIHRCLDFVIALKAAQVVIFSKTYLAQTQAAG